MAAKVKRSLVDNINRRKKAGTSRSKADSHVSSASWKAMKAGWPNSAKKKAGVAKAGGKSRAKAKKAGTKTKKSAAGKAGARKSQARSKAE